jgi:hypothetical protein
MVSLFKKNNMYNVQEYNILYNNDVPPVLVVEEAGENYQPLASNW